MNLYNYPEKDLTTEIILEGKNSKIELRGKSFTNIIINYTARVFIFSGRISEGDYSTKELANWAKISSDNGEHLMNMTIRIVRNNYVVREIELNNIYVISHDEDYGSKTYSIALGQHSAKTNSTYKVIPVNTTHGRVYTLVQAKNKTAESAILALNTAGSAAILKAGVDGVKYLKEAKLVGLKGVSFAGKTYARFNFYYLAVHGSNFVISTSSDLYFKSIGYEDAIGKVNVLRDIYQYFFEAPAIVLNNVLGWKLDRKKARAMGEKAYYWIDLGGAAVGLVKTIGSSWKGIKRLNNPKGINFITDELTDLSGYGIKGKASLEYKKNYIMLSGGAVARDANPILGNWKELSNDR